MIWKVSVSSILKIKNLIGNLLSIFSVLELKIKKKKVLLINIYLWESKRNGLTKSTASFCHGKLPQVGLILRNWKKLLNQSLHKTHFAANKEAFEQNRIW